MIMDKLQLSVRIALNAWEANVKRANAVFGKFTNEELMLEVAPGKNRVIYILGHLIAVHDMLLPLLGLGERLYLQLDEAFISNPDKMIKELSSPGDLRTYWININDILLNRFNSLSPDEWFQKHTMISEEDFAKEPHRNRLSVLISRTAHLAYHLGQVALVKK
jgi:hypothetical protein